MTWATGSSPKELKTARPTTWKCDEAQGFFVAEPMTVQAMEKWLAPTMVDS